MKIKFVYQNGPFYYEAECVNEQERKDAIKGLLYATKDLYEGNLLGGYQTCQSVAENYENEDIREEPQPQIEYATEGQKKYMLKLGIPFTEQTSKVEAMDLIKQYKIKHGIPLK